MQFLGFIAQLVGLVTFAAFIWLLIVAFKRSVLWGILVLLLSPFTAIFFAIKYWSECKKPFLIYAGGSAFSLIYIVMVFAAFGGFTMLDMANDMRKGEFNEQDGQEFIATAIERMEKSGQLDAEERRELQKMKQMFNEMQEADQPKTGTGSPSMATPAMAAMGTNHGGAMRPETHPAGLGAQPALHSPPVFNGEPPLSGYVSTSFQRATQYVGRVMKVVDEDGIEHEGRLAEADSGRLVLERYLGSGTFAITFRRSDVRSVEVYHP